MKCPVCGVPDSRVVDSRPNPEAATTRRRRECTQCDFRFTTYERVDSPMPVVVKVDGTRDPWNRAKLVESVQVACRKRPIGADASDELVDRVERAVCRRGGAREIPSKAVGDAVMEELRELDPIAYIRFASVYLNFNDLEQFAREIRDLTKERG